MKKFTKGALITCLVLFISALLFFVAGFAKEGTNGFKNAFKITDLRWFNGISFATSFDKENWDRKDYYNNVEKEFTFDQNQVEKLSIDAVYAKIDIEESDQDQLEVLINGTKSNLYFNCELTNGEVRIKSKTRKKWFNVASGNTLKIQILLPKDMELSEFNLDVSAGEVTIDLPNVEIKEAVLDVDAGDLTVANLIGHKLTIDVAAGQMLAEKIKTDICEIDCGMGNLEISNLEVSKKLEADVGMGNITIYLKGQEDDFNYDLSCGMGNITLGDKNYSGLGKETKIDNQALIDVILDCGMGNLEVYFK